MLNYAGENVTHMSSASSLSQSFGCDDSIVMLNNYTRLLKNVVLKSIINDIVAQGPHPKNLFMNLIN